MKTKLTALLLAAALALTLAACGEKDIADTPLPDEPPEPVAEQPAADDEWTVLHADDVLLRDGAVHPLRGQDGDAVSYTAIRTGSMTAA